MNKTIHTLIAQLTGISVRQVEQTILLLNEGATIPFISRYRKERTGGLDELQIGAISNLWEKLTELDKRKQSILKAIEEQGKLTAELRQRIADSWDPTEVEDLYLPYRPKRVTRAEIARRKGFEPLAKRLMLQTGAPLPTTADAEALQGARDIIAEWINEHEQARQIVRKSFQLTAVLTAKVIKGKEEEGVKYKDYFAFHEPLSRCSSHRLLALRRGESEGILRVSIAPDSEGCLGRLCRRFVKGKGDDAKQVATAIDDAFKRLLKPAIETEFANQSKAKADAEAIRVISSRLQLNSQTVSIIPWPPCGSSCLPGTRRRSRCRCLLRIRRWRRN